MKLFKPIVTIALLVILHAPVGARGLFTMEHLGIGVNLGYMNYNADFDRAHIRENYNLDTFSLEPRNIENGAVLGISVIPSFRIGSSIWYLDPEIDALVGASVSEATKLEKKTYYDSVVVGRFSTLKSLKFGDWFLNIDVRTGPQFSRGKSDFNVRSGLRCSIWSRYFNFIEGLDYDNIVSRRESLGSLYVPLAGDWGYAFNEKTAFKISGEVDIMLFGLKLVTDDFWVFGFSADNAWVRLRNDIACSFSMSLSRSLKRVTIENEPYFQLARFAVSEHMVQEIRSADGNVFSRNAVFEPKGIRCIIGFRFIIEPNFHPKNGRK
jgi:hypothetical protein